MLSFHDYVLNHCMRLLAFVGSERCCEALQKLGKRYDIVVNIQGDEPLIEPEIIDGVVMALQVVTYVTSP
jgi:CMP-2-keto-3-deoxyoctulosonic acid synthetase